MINRIPRTTLREYNRTNGGVFKNFSFKSLVEAKKQIWKLTLEQVFWVDWLKDPEKLNARYKELKDYWKSQVEIMAKKDFELYVLEKLDELYKKATNKAIVESMGEAIEKVLSWDDEEAKEKLYEALVKWRIVVPFFHHLILNEVNFPSITTILKIIGDAQPWNLPEMKDYINIIDAAVEEFENMDDSTIQGVKSDIFFQTIEVVQRFFMTLGGINTKEIWELDDTIKEVIDFSKENFQKLKDEDPKEAMLKIYVLMIEIRNPGIWFETAKNIV